MLFAGWRLLQGCLVDFAGRVAFAGREGAARATMASGLCLAALLSLPAVVDGGVFSPDLDFSFRNELHSAYISSSSGGTGETRPMLTQTISGYGSGVPVLVAGVFAGLAIGLSALFQGRAGAAACDAQAETNQGFTNYLAALGIVETVAIFAMVFALIALGKVQ